MGAEMSFEVLPGYAGVLPANTFGKKCFFMLGRSEPRPTRFRCSSGEKTVSVSRGWPLDSSGWPRQHAR